MTQTDTEDEKKAAATTQKEEEKPTRSYKFTCEGEGVKSTKSPKLIVPPPGIQIFFLRYGLVKEEAGSYPFFWPQDQEVKKLNPTGAPVVPGYKYVRKRLREEGFVYVYDEKTKKMVKFSIHGHEYLQYTLKKDRTIWACYSEVKWSPEYRKLMVDSAADRSKRMQKIVFADWYKKHNHLDGFHVNEVDSVFETESEQFVFKNRFQSIKLMEDDPGCLLNMFFCLHDPLGCSDDVGADLALEHLKLDVLLESLQTGEDEKYIYKRKISGIQKSAVIVESEKQVGALFSLALTTYQMIYNSPDMIEDYADTIDKQKIIKILGVNERKTLRSSINSLRDAFGTILKSDYYQNVLLDYIENIPDNIETGKQRIADNLTLLSIYPADKDRFLDLKKEFNPAQDKWVAFNLAQLSHSPDNNHCKLFLKTYDIDLLDANKIEAKVNSTLNSIMKAFAKNAVKEKKFEIFSKYITHIKVGEDDLFKIPKKQLENLILSKGYAVSKKNAIVKYRRGVVFVKIEKVNPATTKAILDSKTVPILTNRIASETAKKVDAITKSAGFRKFLAGVNVLNTVAALYKLGKDPNFKNATSATGAVAQLTSAVYSYKETILLAKNVESLDVTIKNVGKTAKNIGYLGSSISIVTSAWDCYDNFQDRDYDASIAWGGAAIVSGILLLESAAFITISLGPFVIISAILIGLIAIAIYFDDTALQSYFKHFPLNKYHPLPGHDGKKPWEFSNAIVRNRVKLVDKGYEKWSDFQTASEDLCDMLIAYRTQKVVLKNLPPPKTAEYHSRNFFVRALRDHMTRDHTQAKQIKVTCSFRKFFVNTSEFQFEIVLFPEGLMHLGNSTTLAPSNVHCQSNNDIESIEVTFDISDAVFNEMTMVSEIIFLSRTIIDPEKNESWPRGDCYQALRISTFNVMDPFSAHINSTISDIFGRDIRIGKRHEVLNPKIWKLTN